MAGKKTFQKQNLISENTLLDQDLEHTKLFLLNSMELLIFNAAHVYILPQIMLATLLDFIWTMTKLKYESN